MVDLRALAERLGQMRPCPCGGLLEISACVPGEPLPFDCLSCHGAGRRLPTEAEVRAAIFEAGDRLVGGVIEKDWVSLGVEVDGALHGSTAAEGEAAPGDLVLLALLRALEVCRG